MIKKAFLNRYEKEAKKELTRYFGKKNYKSIIGTWIEIILDGKEFHCKIESIEFRLFDQNNSITNEAKIFFKNRDLLRNGFPQYAMYKLFHPGYPDEEPSIVVFFK